MNLGLIIQYWEWHRSLNIELNRTCLKMYEYDESPQPHLFIFVLFQFCLLQNRWWDGRRWESNSIVLFKFNSFHKLISFASILPGHFETISGHPIRDQTRTCWGIQLKLQSSDDVNSSIHNTWNANDLNEKIFFLIKIFVCCVTINSNKWTMEKIILFYYF